MSILGQAPSHTVGLGIQEKLQVNFLPPQQQGKD